MEPRVAAGLVLLAFAGGCQTEEHALLLEVRLDSIDGYVEDFEVEVRSLDGDGFVDVQQRNVGRDGIEIDAAPMRVAVTFDAPTTIAVRLASRDTGGAVTHSAFRCYEVTGIVRDAFDLLNISIADLDGDGWVADLAAGCGTPCGAFACPADLVDCDDTSAAVNPGANEVCGADLDCDGVMMECADEDGDTYPACPPGTQDGACDCDDTDDAVHPGVVEECPSSRDLNCDGRAGSVCDRDGDGFFAAVEMGGVPDCDDTNPGVNPEADEVCTDLATGRSPVDENCNGAFDEGCSPDDLDGDGSLPVDGDCDDCDPASRPMAAERCGDGVDQDCAMGDLMCAADDEDGDGVRAVAVGGRDCDDTRDDVYPAAPEQCSGSADEDCDGMVDEGCPDADGDGYVEDGALLLCEGDADRNPGVAEICDGIDQDCDGIVDEDSGGRDGACIRDRAGAAIVVDFTDSLSHCGGCRNACHPRRADSCVDGECQCSTNNPDQAVCDSGLVCCDAGGGNSGCKDFSADFEHCGACGNACDDVAADRCSEGQCRCGGGLPCGPGLECCDGLCVNLESDPNNCSRCGSRCGRGEQCVSQICTCYDDAVADGVGEDACKTSDVCCARDQKCRKPSSC